MNIPDHLRKHRIIHRAIPLDLLPTPEDLERVDAMDPCECPRRYCWWWATLSLDWDKSIAEGCTFDKHKHPSFGRRPFPEGDFPCKRLDPASPHDHYEPHDANMIEDAIPDGRWDCPPG
jgi:hypothetical protein